mmetsp:Transcript_7835/g.21346  ORF Transcript_7835/g.21346 Transcript_7835/m.21346 type:complete len:240 (-) Transcript_7835:704-1423(-)
MDQSLGGMKAQLLQDVLCIFEDLCTDFQDDFLVDANVVCLETFGCKKFFVSVHKAIIPSSNKRPRVVSFHDKVWNGGGSLVPLPEGCMQGCRHLNQHFDWLRLESINLVHRVSDGSEVFHQYACTVLNELRLVNLGDSHRLSLRISRGNLIQDGYDLRIEVVLSPVRVRFICNDLERFFEGSRELQYQRSRHLGTPLLRTCFQGHPEGFAQESETLDALALVSQRSFEIWQRFCNPLLG